MSYQASSKKVIGAAYILLAMVGCSPPAATATPALAQELSTNTPTPPTATETPIIPTATETPVPPTATETPVPPTATVTPTQIPTVGTDITVELPEGDPIRGEELANAYLVEGVKCVNCHLGGRPPGPVLTTSKNEQAIRERAAQRIAGEDYTGASKTPEQYLIESILQPKAYLVEGRWASEMPLEYGQVMTKQDLADIIAWLLTLE